MSKNASKPGSFVRQAAMLAGASLFVRLIGFFYRIPLTNLIGDVGNAYYNSAYTVYTFALNISSVYMIATISRLASERIALGQFKNAHGLFKTAMCFSLVLGVIAFLAMFFGAAQIVALLHFPEGAAYAVRALSPAVFVVSMLTVFRGYFQGMKTSFPTALSQVIEQIFKVSAALILLFVLMSYERVELSAAGAAAGTSVSVVAALGVVAGLYGLISKDLRNRAEQDETEQLETRRTQIAAIVRTAYPMVIMLSLFSIANMLDIGMANGRIYASGAFTDEEVKVMLGQFTGKFIILTTLPISLSASLSAAVIPEIASSHATLDKEAVREKTNMALRISMMLSIPAAVMLSVLADPIIGLLFPLQPEGGWLLRYGAISIIFLAITQIITGVLQGVGRVKVPVVGIFFGLLVKIPLNYYLMYIPSINILGAVISTVACFVVAATVNMLLLYRFTGILPQFVSTFAKPLIASLGMGLVCFSVYQLANLGASSTVATIAALASGFFAYMVLMVLIRGFRQADLEAMPIPQKLRGLLRL